MNCPNCNTEIPEGGQFCPQCGAVIEPAPQPVAEQEQSSAPEAEFSAPQSKFCPQCGAAVLENAALCPQCGHVFGAVYPPTSEGDTTKNGLATASMVLGILSLTCCGGIAGILALIFGILGRKSQNKGQAISGIVMGIISIVLMVIVLIIWIAAFVGGVAESSATDPYIYEFFNDMAAFLAR